VVIDRNGQPFDCAVRVLAAEANRLRREARLVEHLEKRGVLHAERIGRTVLTWIRAADHSRESARFVASGKHFFDARRQPSPEDQEHPESILEIIMSISETLRQKRLILKDTLGLGLTSPPTIAFTWTRPSPGSSVPRTSPATAAWPRPGWCVPPLGAVLPGDHRLHHPDPLPLCGHHR
jgi:heme exporter protein D